MVSSFTTNKGFDKPANGDYVDTWNIPVNADWDIADRAFGGTFSVSLTNVNVTLTKTNCQNVRILLTGNLSGNIIIYFPAGVSGFFVVTDATTGAYTVTLSSAGGPGLAVNTIQGTNCFIFTDGVNVFYADDSRGSVVAGTGITVTGVGTQTVSLTTPVAVSNGGTGVSSFTAGNLVVGNGTSPLQVIAPGTAGNVLTSTGSAWQSAPPSGTGGGITSISFQTGTAMGLSFTVGGGPATVTSSGQTVLLDGTLAMGKGGTGVNSISSGVVKSNGSSLSGGNLVSLTSEVTGTLPQANGGTGTLGSGVGTALGQGISTGTGYFILNNSATLTSPTINNATSSSPNITGTASIAAANFSGTANFNSTPVIAPTSTSGTINFTAGTYYINFNQGTQSFGIYTTGAVCSGSPSQYFIYGTPYSPQANFNIISDRRIKKDVASYDKGLEDIASLNPITFKYNGTYGTKDDGVTKVGLLAQDVQQSRMSEMVETYKYVDPVTNEETDIYVLNPSDAVFALINAVKELDARVKALEAKASGG